MRLTFQFVVKTLSMLLFFCVVTIDSSAHDQNDNSNYSNFVYDNVMRGNVTGENSKLEQYQLTDGVYMRFLPDDHESTTLSFKMNVTEFKNVLKDTGRRGGGVGGGGKGKDKKLLQRLLPLFILPFLVQSAIIPVFLSALKMMLMKSLMVGKLALILIVINALRNSNSFKSRSEERLADAHYGYHGNGMEEYGAYFNRRSFL